MCKGPSTTTRAEKQLADLVNNDLGVSVDARALALFIKHRWSRITALAHSIHASDEGPQS